LANLDGSLFRQEDKKMKKLNRNGIRALIAPFRWIIISSVILLLASGEFFNFRFWIFIIISFTATIINSIVIYKYSPEILNKRGRSGVGTKKWDLFLIIPYILISVLIVPLIVGLDAVRYRWSSLDFYWMIPGIVLYLSGYIIISKSLLENLFFEGTVRIQKEDNHTVISTGPYSEIRHPGYAGMLLGAVSIPMILGSLYAYIPVCIMVILLLIRTYLEDRTLISELQGYSEYILKTRYRLIPGVW
jgi:protein-S-isoprenylcysteine O-methyltransferase Ste14